MSDGGVLGRREALVAIALQGLGPAAYLAVVLLVARALGADAQGELAVTKAWLDLAVAFGALGLGQGVTYVIGKRLAAPRQLLAPAFGVAALAGAVLVPLGLVAWQRGDPALPYPDLAAVALVTAAGSLGVLAAIGRGVLLALSDGRDFSLSVSAQPLALLALVLGVVAGGLPFRAEALFLVSFAAAALFIALALARRGAFAGVTGAGRDRGPLHRVLFGAGAQALAQNAAMALAPVASLWLLQRLAGFDTAALGVWSVATAVFQAIASPLAMIAPLLFARWSAAGRDDLERQAEALSGMLWRRSLLPTVALALSSLWLVPRVFGDAFAAAAPAAALMALSLPALVVSRVLAPALFAAGAAAALSALLALRLAAVVGIGALALSLSTGEASAYTAMAFAWLVGEASFCAGALRWRRALSRT